MTDVVKNVVIPQKTKARKVKAEKIRDSLETAREMYRCCVCFNMCTQKYLACYNSHRFCEDCSFDRFNYDKIRFDSYNQLCPKGCRKKLIMEPFYQFNLYDLYKALRVPLEECPYKSQGCKMTSKHVDYYNGHIHSCPFGMTKCLLCGQSIGLDVSKAMDHYSSRHNYVKLDIGSYKITANVTPQLNIHRIIALTSTRYVLVASIPCITDPLSFQVVCTYVPVWEKLTPGNDMRVTINGDVKLITHSRYEIKSKKIPLGVTMSIEFPDYVPKLK